MILTYSSDVIVRVTCLSCLSQQNPGRLDAIVARSGANNSSDAKPSARFDRVSDGAQLPF